MIMFGSGKRCYGTTIPSRIVHLSNSIELHAAPSRIGRNGIEDNGMEINSTELDRTGRVGKKRLHEREVTVGERTSRTERESARKDATL